MRWIWITLIALLALSGCPAPEGEGAPETAPAVTGGSSTAPATTPSTTPADTGSVQPTVIVWADPLLEQLLTGLAPEFQREWPAGYHVEYLEVPELKARLESEKDFQLPGVFLYPGGEMLSYLVETGVAEETTARIFAGDRLVLIQQAGGGYQAPSLFDVYTLIFNTFAVAAPETSAGFFADQALVTEALKPKIPEKMVICADAQAAVETVRNDERAIGLVPASAIVAAEGVEAFFEVGEDLYEDIQYRAIASTDEAAGALRFMMFLSENEEIQGLIPGYGYLDLETAFIED